MSERCEVCDRPRATDEQWRDVPPGERDDLCWGREQCEAGAVDWRARTELARLDLAAAIARAERAEGLCAEAMYALGQQGRPADLMPMAVRAVVSRADAAEVRAERAEAQLAALREAAADVRVAFYDLSVPHRVAVERHAVLDAALADTAAAAEAYRASVEAPLRAEIERITARHDRRLAVIDDVRVALASPDGEDIRVAARRVVAERDTLAAALAEVRSLVEAMDSDALRYGLGPVLDAVAALPADLAVERDRRVRAEALEDAADAFGADGQDLVWEATEQCAEHVSDWLRARAADERGGR